MFIIKHNCFLDFQTRTVAKPEAIYSKLKLDNDYELVDNGTYDLLTHKIDDVGTCLVPEDHNSMHIVQLKI